MSNDLIVQKFTLPNNSIILGIDEVGRGSLIGPVITCCVSINTNNNKLFNVDPPTLIDDSKKMSAKSRKLIVNWLSNEPNIKYTIGSASVNEIDELNIRNANNLAMDRALFDMTKIINNNSKASIVCHIDGNYFKPLHEYNFECKTLIKGDTKNIAIALASIIAKEYRDDLIINLSKKEKNNYGWSTNAGYGTKQHHTSILNNGLSIHHRLTFIKIMWAK